MKHGFLVLTHFSPQKTCDLISRLSDPDHYFVIHFDKKTRIDETDPFYQKLVADKNVTVLKDRVDVQWGGYRIINADLNMMREILKHKDIDYVHLVTGQCLPIKSKAYMREYFTRHKGKQFIDTFLMPRDSKEHGLAYNRVNKYHLHDLFNPRSKKTKDKIIGQINVAFRKLQGLLKFAGIYRRYPSHYPPIYAGSAWWSLSYDACKYVVDYVDVHPDFHKRFRYTQFVDEMFIQTVIMNSPFKDHVVNNNLRFIDFIFGTSSPKDLTMEHMEAMSKPDFIFARKFGDPSKELIAYLDKHVVG